MAQAHGSITCHHEYRMALSHDEWDMQTAVGVHVDRSTPGHATVALCGAGSRIPDTFILLFRNDRIRWTATVVHRYGIMSALVRIIENR